MKKIAHHERNNFESGRGVSLEFWVGKSFTRLKKQSGIEKQNNRFVLFISNPDIKIFSLLQQTPFQTFPLTLSAETSLFSNFHTCSIEVHLTLQILERFSY